MTRHYLPVLVLIGVPLLEIYLFIKIGGAIGAWSTVTLVVLMAFIGIMLVRRQGIATFRRAQAALRRDELPALELLEGAALLLSGALLLIPGFFTDAVALLLLWPVSRKLLLARLMPRVQIIARNPSARPRDDNARIIDGQYRRKPDG
jgi:UPF0716 protein FxsA